MGSIHKFLVIIEKSENNYAAYSPDLPGRIATGATREETGLLMHETIALHIEGMKEDNIPIPESTATAEYFAVG